MTETANKRSAPRADDLLSARPNPFSLVGEDDESFRLTFETAEGAGGRCRAASSKRPPVGLRRFARARREQYDKVTGYGYEAMGGRYKHYAPAGARILSRWGGSKRGALGHLIRGFIDVTNGQGGV